MTSKWIEELYEFNSYEDRKYAWEQEIIPILERIDKLLRKAMLEVDNENLHDKIYNEIHGKPMLTTDNFGEFEDTK